jgi:phosphoribosyl-AMP cyclohydrolase / phosphoribosyl-ATP pyrophosphohydrolase
MIVSVDNLSRIDFGKANGLVTAIAQHALTGEILMVAWMNEEALRLTLASGQAVFYSRSRQQLWRKGETSGHILQVTDILTDCDHDALLLRVMPQGPACHTAVRSCFMAEDTEASEFALAPDFLHRLQLIIDSRINAAANAAANPQATAAAQAKSYTVKLLESGLRRIAQKVGEEGLEAALAGAAGDREELRNESADLLFHLLLLLRQQGLSLDDVLATLAARHEARKRPSD